MIIKSFFKGKWMWLVVAGLLTTSAASAYTAKRFYDRHSVAQQQMLVMEKTHEAAKARFEEAINLQVKQYQALTSAFEEQQREYAAARQQVVALRGKISELKTRSPEVKAYLDTPVPDALYDQLFSPDKG